MSDCLYTPALAETVCKRIAKARAYGLFVAIPECQRKARSGHGRETIVMGSALAIVSLANCSLSSGRIKSWRSRTPRKPIPAIGRFVST